MRWNKLRWLVFGLILLLGLLSGVGSVQAASPTAATGFVLTPLLPKNQLDKQAGYFNLQLTPGTTQTLSVAVSNPSKSPVTIRVTPVNATTADTGNVVYVPSDRSDPSATTTFTQMTTAGVTVNLAAHQAKNVSFKVTIPKNGFKGEVLGGLFATNTASSTTKNKSNQGFVLKNRYAEVTAVALWSQSRQPVPIKLDLANVKVNTQNEQPVVVAKIRNLAPTLFGQLKLQSRVTQVKTGTTVATQQLKSGSVAPNSWFNYQVALGTQRLAAGQYRLNLHLTSGQKVWNFQQNFQLTAHRAQQHNQHLVGPRRINWWLWAVVAVVILLALLVTAYWFGQRRSRKG
ncbi:DUF916 and DUF3324 domain-containing protein [Lactiplantibacillus herbarum]|uniref:DUF916 and DUF3324 domain-containing protein n=1 Tax=Lactiplantibacillus herbarum TaxID=1670446 RepID=UPI00064ED37F|nr:DUF916 and DUF3324 domain-containing protein [Lactiplantibacillus herbarum]